MGESRYQEARWLVSRPLSQLVCVLLRSDTAGPLSRSSQPVPPSCPPLSSALLCQPASRQTPPLGLLPLHSGGLVTCSCKRTDVTSVRHWASVAPGRNVRTVHLLSLLLPTSPAAPHPAPPHPGSPSRSFLLPWSPHQLPA